MGWFDQTSDEANAYNDYQYKSQDPQTHEASLSHELIAGAAAFEAAKAWENHCEENGKPEDHATAKELIAGFAGAFIDREVETKGLDFVDRERAKYDAQRRLEAQVASEY